MSSRADWCYVQARLHARHGGRLDAVGWRVLESARSLDHFLERSRSTILHNFTDRIVTQMSSHTIERVLRAEWRAYVTEVAAWVRPSWRTAVLWVAYLPDLPVVDQTFKVPAPDWIGQDPILAALSDHAPQTRGAALAASPLAPLMPAAGINGALVDQWFAHWRILWPREWARDLARLEKLADLVARHFETLAQAGPQDSSGQYRQDLARALAHTFRWHSGSPVGLFSHLALVALDLERLRGGLIRRRLFAAEHAKRAA